MGKKILVVDDEKPIVELISFNLKKEGHEIISANDGEDGYNKALNEKPDLILLDVMLPKMDGFTLAKEIRLINQEVPIIFLTAKNLKSDILDGFKVGADDYLTKPFNILELKARIRALLKRSARTAKPASNMLTFGTISAMVRQWEKLKH